MCIRDRSAPVQSSPVQSSPVQSSPVQSAPVQSAPLLKTASQPSSAAVTLAGNNEWGECIEQTDLIGLPKELAMNCACERLTEDKIDLALSPKLKHLFKPDRLKLIEKAIATLNGKPVTLNLEVEESDKETPAECLERLGHEQFEHTKQQFADDPGVKAIMTEFGATLNENSIKPS